MNEPAARHPEGGIEFRLTVWPDGGLGWHACIVAPDNSRREFGSPFELARYLTRCLARPAVVVRPGDGQGLR
ncbi:MAG: hypothetical protein ABIX12_02820 [Rubrivivax sp.]